MNTYHTDIATTIVGLDRPETVAGLYLGSNLEFPSFGPTTGIQLAQIAGSVRKLLKEMTDPSIVGALRMYYVALRYVANVGVVQQAVILDKGRDIPHKRSDS